MPLNIERRSDKRAEEVGPGPAPSPCKTVSPTGLLLRITAFITPLIFPKYVSFPTRHGCTLSNKWLFNISVIPSNLILKFNCFAISISFNSIFSIPSIKQLLFEIFLLKAKEDNIFTFAKASYPFKSNLGLEGSE